MSQPTRSQRALARGFVTVQFGLVALLLFPARRSRPGAAARAAGLGLLGAGGGLGVAGALALGPSLTPSPLPTTGAELRTDGLYGRLRHPIYAGLTLAAAGRAVCTGARRHRAAALGLGALLQAKARYEERGLAARFPGYDAYQSRTPRWLPAPRGGNRPCGS